SAFGPNGNGVDLTAFRESKDPRFSGVLAVQLLHNLENGQKAMTVHWDRAKRLTAALPVPSLSPGAFHHAQINLRFAEARAGLDVTLASHEPGKTNAPQHPVSQLLIPGLRPFAGRVQIAARIGHWDQTIDLDNLRVECAPTGQGSTEEIDLASQISALRPG